MTSLSLNRDHMLMDEEKGKKKMDGMTNEMVRRDDRTEQMKTVLCAAQIPSKMG